MIEKALRKQLRPIVNRRRRLYLAWRLSACWFISGLIGIILIAANWLWGWNSPVVNWVLCILTLLVTVIILYKYSHMHPDYKAVARNIEKQHPEMQALLLAAIEQQPQGLGGQFGYLQERVIGEAVRHAVKYDWLRSISSTKLALAQIGWFVTLAFLIAAFCQLLPSQPFLFKTGSNSFNLFPGMNLSYVHFQKLFF